MKSILITGAAGFIGFHLSRYLMKRGEKLIGIDSLNHYYSPPLKQARIQLLKEEGDFNFVQLDMTDKSSLNSFLSEHKFSHIIHLAAQAGVRYSLDRPDSYISNNINGFMNLLEACREIKPVHLIYASSSSVYGLNQKIPFAEEDRTDQPASLYAATKKSNELMAHSYSHLFRIPTTGLRFFTVYGSWGRPDMSYYKFAAALHKGQPIDLYNNGDMQRDFTYIDDAVEVINRLIELPPPDEGNSPPCRVLNLGNNHPVNLEDFVDILIRLLGVDARKNLLPMQAGDVQRTYAQMDNLASLIGFSPTTRLDEGLARFVQWFKKIGYRFV